jgi:hypothetical protein
MKIFEFLITFRVMLNSVPGHLLSIPKNENKVKVNVEKMILYNFETLNAQITRKNFLISKLNLCPGHCLAVSLFLILF